MKRCYVCEEPFIGEGQFCSEECKIKNDSFLKERVKEKQQSHICPKKNIEIKEDWTIKPLNPKGEGEVNVENNDIDLKNLQEQIEYLQRDIQGYKNIITKQEEEISSLYRAQRKNSIDNEIKKTLKQVFNNDLNEITASPYWLIITPRQLMKKSASSIAGCITGPFFSREAAELTLDQRRHHFSKDAVVWCCSGHMSPVYERFCQNIREEIKDERRRNEER